MRVNIRYGDSFDELSKPTCSYTHKDARRVVLDAIRSGHARHRIYVISRDVEAERRYAMSDETKALLRARSREKHERSAT